MSLPSPQLIADASALNVFAQAVSQSASKLVTIKDQASIEYQELDAYFKENLPKLKTIIERLEKDLG